MSASTSRRSFLGSLGILKDRTPAIDVTKSLAVSVAGIVAHQSALKGG